MTLNSPRWLSWYYLVAMAANLFIFVVVNFWNHRARYLFITRNPEIVEKKVPTISHSISDPYVGESFAYWITICAVLLVLIVVPIIWMHLRAAYEVRDILPWLFPITVLLAVIGGICEVTAAAGIGILSNYRFPDHNAEHMMGSYLFFGAQALAILISSIICLIFALHKGFNNRLYDIHTLRPRMNSIRWKFGLFTVLSVLTYVLLFFAKNWDFTFGKSLVFHSYVYLEPMVITFFLGYLLLFNVDLWYAAVKTRRRTGR